MKAVIVASLLALSFATGFTCSKNQPAEAPATQEQMAAPAAEATPAAEAAAPAAPAEAAPATETK